MLLKNRWSKQGKQINIELLQDLSRECNIRGHNCIEMMKDLVLEISSRNPKMKEKDIINRFEAYGDIDDNSSAESLEDDMYVQFHDMNPHVNDCRALLEIIEQVSKEKCELGERFRYLDQQGFTLDVEPDSKKKRR